MSDPAPLPRRGLSAAATPGSALQLMQGAVVVVAVLYFARDLLIPLVLAVLLSFVLAPLVRVLRRVSIPRSAAVVIVVLSAFAVLSGIGTLMGGQATSLAGNLPSYQATISAKLEGLRSIGGLVDRMSGVIASLGRSVAPHETAQPPSGGEPASLGQQSTAPHETGQAALGSAPPAQPAGGRIVAEQRPVPVELHSPNPTAFEVLQRVAEPLLGPLATAGVVIILVIFILLYREDLRDRLIRLAGARDLHRTMAAMDDAAYRLSRFFLAQTGMNTAFGLFIAGALWVIGIPNPLLWGFIAGLMRFVPFIGIFVAVTGPLLLAVAVDPGWSTLVWVGLLFALSEMLMGQVFEPLVFGHSTGLSPIAVIAAATFWTWLWGPIGLLLAVPLTVCLVVLGRHVDRLEFLEVMLGDQPALDPEETFYQRALAGDADALAEQAERCLKEGPLVEYLDAVALPALRLAQQDAVHGALAPDRRAALKRSIETLAEDLEEADDPKPPPGEEPAPLPPEWQEAGTVLCLPGRGPFDAEAATMLGQALTRRGFGVRLGGEAAPGSPPRLLCLCLLDGGASAATARYLLRRARRRLPDVAAIAMVWSAESESPLAAALRSEGTPEAPLPIASSLAEVLDLAVEASGTLRPAMAEASARTPPPAPEPPGLTATATA